MIKKTYPLLLIFFISLIVRSINVTKFPPSLNWDEVSLGYNTYSILNTGKDEWGINLPLIFRSYGDFKLPLYIYLSLIPVSILGLNPLSIKLVSVVSGSIAPVIIYLLANKMVKNKKVSFLISLTYALSPWSIFLSRIALEANLFLTIFLLSLYFLLSSQISLSLVFFSLGLFSYNSGRVLYPFYILAIIFYFIKHKTPLRKHFYSIAFFLIASFIFIFQSTSLSGQARLKWVSLIDEGAVNQINQLRTTYPRIIANKLTYFVYKASQNYLSHFNPDFLFVTGGSHYQFNIPNFYLISPLFAPFLLVGIFYLLKNKQYLILFTFLISPLPSSITRDAPHTLRSIVFVSLATYISSMGLYFATKLINKNQKILFLICTLVIITTNQFNFWKKYSKYSTTYSQSWQYGYQQAVDLIKQHYHDYENIYITKRYGEPHEFILFYWPWSPSDYQNDNNLTWDYHTAWYWVDKFDKFTFINDWEMPQTIIPKNTLVISSPDSPPPKSGKIIQTINFLDQSTAFQLFSYE